MKEENPSKIDELLNKKKAILRKHKLNIEDFKKVDIIEKEISEEIEDKEIEKLINVLGDLQTGKGKTNTTNVWKQLRKAYPKKNNTLPTGVKNIEGKVINNPNEKKKVTLAHFKHRMRTRTLMESVDEEVKENKTKFEHKLEEAKQNKSIPFKMEELEAVIKSLKTGKSKDPDKYIRELFREGVVGNDLKLSVFLMMNKMKEQICIPDALKRANITILHKRKCKLDLNNWRGVFVSSVLRNILMKLIHERTYPKIDKSMTDSQIGARRNKSVRNHIFVLNAIMSDVLKNNQPAIDLHIMDFKQMFDAEELEIVLDA